MRHKTVILLCLVKLFLSPPQARASADRASPDPRDSSGIALMLRRLENSFNKKDLRGILSCFSDDAVTVFPIEHEEPVLGRRQFESFLAAGLEHPENEVAERLFIDATGDFTLRQNGDVAEMLLTHAVRVPSVRDTPAVIGFVRKDFATVCYKNGHWQICFMFPCFAESNAVVAEVVSGGQAESLGIRPGDVITHHLRMPILSAEQLVWRRRMFEERPADTKLRVLFRRDGQVLARTFRPGDMGINTRNFFHGTVETKTLLGSDARQHPVAKTIDSYHSALRAASVNGIRSVFCSEGFAFPYGLPSAMSSTLITAGNASESIPFELRRIVEQWDLTTMRVSDIRVISHGDLALAGWSFSVRTTSGQRSESHPVVCAVQHNGKWSFVGMPWQSQHTVGPLNLHVPADREGTKRNKEVQP